MPAVMPCCDIICHPHNPSPPSRLHLCCFTMLPARAREEKINSMSCKLKDSPVANVSKASSAATPSISMFQVHPKLVLPAHVLTEDRVNLARTVNSSASIRTLLIYERPCTSTCWFVHLRILANYKSHPFFCVLSCREGLNVGTKWPIAQVKMTFQTWRVSPAPR